WQYNASATVKKASFAAGSLGRAGHFIGGKGVGGPAFGLQSFGSEGGPTSRTLILIGGVVILLSATQGASAFSTRQVDPMITSDRLADPNGFADKMSNRQSGERTFGLPGGQLRLQFRHHSRAAP